MIERFQQAVIAASMALMPAGSQATEPRPATAVLADRDAAIDCLAKAIAHEAGNEPESGQQAVAEVVLNRVAHRIFPKTVCGVVFQGSERRTGCQFTFTCDGALRRAIGGRVWNQARRIAVLALDGGLPGSVGAATHYHADYVAPRWAPSLVRIRKLGAHIFYSFPGDAASSASGRAPLASRPENAPLRGTQVFSVWGLTAATLAPHGGRIEARNNGSAP